MSLKGLVQQHQVDIAAVKARERALQRGFGGFIAVVFHPDFAGDEKFAARHAALFDALPHFAFIGISLGGVNVPKTPKPRTGISTPLFRVKVCMVFSSVIAGWA